MPVFTDQLGRNINITTPPTRIVSLVPSQTELLYSLGLDEQVIGITKFCIHPQDWFREKTRVGGTKTIHPEVIHTLAPDLIIANKEENVKDQIEALAEQYPVYISDVNTLDEAYGMIQDIGVVTSASDKAAALVKSIQQGFDTLTALTKPIPTAYLIWRDPYMTIGNDTFIHHILSHCGLTNVFAQHTRYPAITVEDLQASNCRLLLLSSEPYPFKQKHIDELQVFLPNTKILLVDGELFSWYGSRLLHTPPYLNTLLQQVS